MNTYLTNPNAQEYSSDEIVPINTQKKKQQNFGVNPYTSKKEQLNFCTQRTFKTSVQIKRTQAWPHRRSLVNFITPVITRAPRRGLSPRTRVLFPVIHNFP